MEVSHAERILEESLLEEEQKILDPSNAQEKSQNPSPQKARVLPVPSQDPISVKKNIRLNKLSA
jgi:hypothetical protein